MDPERIGALIDGRLTPEERTQVLAHLTASEQDRDVFADTAAVLRALEEEAAESPAAVAIPQVPPPAPALPPERSRPSRGWARDTRRRVPRWAWGAAAAAIVLAVALSVVMRRVAGTIPAPEDHLAVLVRDDAVAPEVPRWSLRGEAPGAGMRASRLGVVHVRLRLAFERDDRARRDSLLAVARDLVRNDATLTQAYNALARPRSTKDNLAEVGERAARAVGEERFRLGAWAEAARLASLGENEAFIQASWNRRALDRAAVLPGLPDEAYDAVDDLRGALPTHGGVNWTVLRQATARLVTALTQ